MARFQPLVYDREICLVQAILAMLGASQPYRYRVNSCTALHEKNLQTPMVVTSRADAIGGVLTSRFRG
jgi:hypothetical protein